MPKGSGAIISITGEPGIGKSRLVAEAEKRFRGCVSFFTGHAVSYTETIPYWPVRELLRDWLGLGGSDSEARVRLELRAALLRWLEDDSEDAYPFVASLCGVPLEPEVEQRIRDLAPDAVRHETFAWLYQLVSTLARQRPLCLVLEDLHWSDEATLALLDELLAAAENRAVAFVLVHRSDPRHPAWQLVDRARRRFPRLFVELELEPLGESDARALVEAATGGDLDEDVADLLVERAGGNPYFVGEAVRDLLERGALERERGRLVLVGEPAIPAAIQEALQARLDRLDVEARELLATAAVIGTTFNRALLDRLLPQRRLEPTLSKLRWLRLVVEERGGDATEYRFRHGLVQEVAYGTLVESRRRDLHRRVGEALLELYPDSAADVYGLLARHFAEADDSPRALEFLLKAGDAARIIYAQDEAVELYRRALGFMESSGDERARATLLKVALTHHLAFDYRAANEAFREAFAQPAPRRPRLEPRERITWAMPSAWDREATPGHSFSQPAFEVTRNLFCGLLAIGRDFDIEPALAETVAVSDDGRSYRFTLRADSCWSDGVPVTAHDFAFTFPRMMEDGVYTASWLDGVDARAVDSRTLEIRLRDPRNDFLYLLAMPPFFPWPRHVYERSGPNWHRAVPLVGNGPFVLTHRDENCVVMSAAPTWSEARGNVKEVRLELEASPAAAAARWRRGAYDALHSILTFHAESDDRTVIQRSAGAFTWYLGFNARHAPVDDPRTRRALAHAIDRSGPSQALGATAAGAGGLIPPPLPGHSSRVAPAFDPDRARALLTEVGHPDGDSLGEIVLACLELWGNAASNVAAQLAEIGVRVQVISEASDPDLDRVIEQAHAFLWAWVETRPTPVTAFELILREYSALYRDEQLEDLLARAKLLGDQDELLRTCREFERIWIGEQVAVVPIAYADELLWLRPWVTEMWVNSTGICTFDHAVVRPATDFTYTTA